MKISTLARLGLLTLAGAIALPVAAATPPAVVKPNKPAATTQKPTKPTTTIPAKNGAPGSMQVVGGSFALGGGSGVGVRAEDKQTSDKPAGGTSARTAAPATNAKPQSFTLDGKGTDVSVEEIELVKPPTSPRK